MLVLILILLVLNAVAYAWVYITWRKDCKEIGRENLAVSLGERIKMTFVVYTLPCLLSCLYMLVKD